MKHLHWTQRPENAAKVAALGKARWANKGAKQAQTNGSIPAQFETLRLQAINRMQEISEQIEALQKEKEELKQLTGLS